MSKTEQKEKEAFLGGVAVTLFVLGAITLVAAEIIPSSRDMCVQAMFVLFGAGSIPAAIVFWRADLIPRWSFRILAVTFCLLASAPLWYS